MLLFYENSPIFNLKEVVEKLQSNLLLTQQENLKTQCANLPKLRTFIKFKDFCNTPSYLTKPLSFIQRKFLAKIRLGCLEIRIETGRYARPRLTEEARTCQVCPNPQKETESEHHFLFECQLYENERKLWLTNITVPFNFTSLSPDEKFNVVLNDHINVKCTSQYIINNFDKRSKVISSLPKENSEQIPVFHLLPHDQCPACTHI